jgi:hypothetical protein
MNWAELNLYLDAMTADELRTTVRELMLLCLTDPSRVAESVRVHGSTRPGTALVFLWQGTRKPHLPRSRH